MAICQSCKCKRTGAFFRILKPIIQIIIGRISVQNCSLFNIQHCSFACGFQKHYSVCTLALTCFLIFWLTGASSQLFPHSWGISGYSECCSALIHLPSGILKMHIFPFDFLLTRAGFNATFLLPLARYCLQATSLLPAIKAQTTTQTLFHPS